MNPNDSRMMKLIRCKALYPVIPALIVAYCVLPLAADREATNRWTAWADEKSESAKDHDHEHGDHEHSHEHPAYLYGNHACPTCGEPVDPHLFANVKNAKRNIYGRIYICCRGCGKTVEKQVAKYYMQTYRTDKESGKEIPPRDLKNANCPSSGEAVDGKTSIEYNGMTVHFCCPECIESFLKDPETGMAKLLPEAKDFKFEPPEHSHDDEHDHDHEHEEEK